jgi:hypothetical protein
MILTTGHAGDRAGTEHIEELSSFSWIAPVES